LSVNTKANHKSNRKEGEQYLHILDAISGKSFCPAFFALGQQATFRPSELHSDSDVTDGPPPP
jgi:hypothetical protein